MGPSGGFEIANAGRYCWPDGKLSSDPLRVAGNLLIEAAVSKQVLGIIVLVVAFVGGLVWYSQNVLTNKWKFVPQTVFETAFDEPFNRAEKLVATKEDAINYSVYMHFKYPHECKPKNESQYQTQWCAEARDWFNAKYPNDPGLQEINRLKFRKRTFNDTTTVTNEWLLYNPRTDDHYYRIWGTSR